jgi:hypothetical protein
MVHSSVQKKKVCLSLCYKKALFIHAVKILLAPLADTNFRQLGCFFIITVVVIRG